MQEATEISSIKPEQSVFDSREYKRSRKSYTIECMFEYFIANLVSGQFLTVLLKHLGVPDSLNGIIQSIISLAFLFQFFSVFIIHRINNTKRTVIIFHTTSQLFFVLLFCIPFFPIAAEIKHVMALICPLVAYFGNYFVTSIIYRWGNSFVEPHHRGRFGAVKEIISLVTAIILVLVMGYAVDLFETSGNIEGAFILLAAAILVFCLSDFICLLLIKNDKKSREEREKADIHLPMGEIMRNTMGNKYFRSTVVLATLWKAAVYTTVGFMGTYMDNASELNFSVGTVQVVMLVGMFSRMLVAGPVGRYSDKHSYAKGIRVGLFLGMAGYLINTFTAPGGFTRYLIIPFYICYMGSLAATDANMLNLPYNYVDAKYFIHASAIKNSISGIGGFAASLLAGALLSYIQNNGNMIFGIHVYGQQVLSFLSFLILVIATFYSILVVEKQKRIDQ